MTAVLADPALQAALRLSLALMFAAAALHKILAPAAFAATLRNYRVVPTLLSGGVAATVIGAELATAALLLFLPASRVGTAAALGLLALYSTAIAVALARGLRDIDCGCLGPGHRQPLSEWLLARNGALAAAAAALLVPVGARPLAGLDLFSVLAFTLALTFTWIAANRLLQTVLPLAARGRA